MTDSRVTREAVEGRTFEQLFRSACRKNFKRLTPEEFLAVGAWSRGEAMSGEREAVEAKAALTINEQLARELPDAQLLNESHSDGAQAWRRVVCAEILRRMALSGEMERQWKSWGVVEIAVRNPQVADYCQHWEGRAEAAEAEVVKLRDVLELIANHPHNAYYSDNSVAEGNYSIGVTDGHRCAAKIAESALNPGAAKEGLCLKCGNPKEPSRPNSKYCRACDGRDPVTGERRSGDGQ